MKIKEDRIQLFDSTNIDSIIWPDSKEAELARKLLVPLIQKGLEPFFHNIKTVLNLIKIDDFILPITINDDEKENSYVCSFHSYYIGYGLNSAETIKNQVLKHSVKTILKGLGALLRRGKIDKVVSVNNWLFSTNIHPKLSNEQIGLIKTFIQNKFPDHAIVFRSINSLDSNSPLESLKDHEFDLIATRQVFLMDTNNREVFESRLFKSDLKFLESSDYTLKEIDYENEKRLNEILSLYNALYVDKYSSINPRLKESFLDLLIRNKLFKFKYLEKDGSLDGIVGFYSLYGVMTSPFFGYDTTKSQQIGLYRLLSTALTLEAKNESQLFHQSSGASFYKSIRKAKPVIEYSAVYTKHLPKKRRIYWKTLKALMNQFGVRWMKKY